MMKEKIEELRLYIISHKKLSIAGAFILFFLIIFGIIATTLSSSSTSPNTVNNPNVNNITNNPPNGSDSPSSPQHIYFVKTDYTNLDTSPIYEIYEADARGSAVTLRGKLHSLANQIYPLSPEKYLYIGDLGFLDRGNNIYLFDTAKNSSAAIYSASKNYQIETYVFLPEKDALIVWEETAGSTNQGNSQIVFQEINNTNTRKVLLTEPLSGETKYPLFYSPLTNLIYLDSYSVNRNGNNRGVFSLSFDGKIAPVAGLSLNQYSASPALSSSGRYLAFTSYNPSARKKIPSPPVPNQIFREAVRNPNQIKLRDLTSGTVALLTENLDGTIFDNLLFGLRDDTVIFRTLSINDDHTSTPLDYKKITLADKNATSFATNPNGIILAQYGDQTVTFAMRSEITLSQGNLTTPFSQLLSSVYSYDPATRVFTKILGDDSLQIIAIK